MPSLNPFASSSGRHNITHFDIRLENDFIVFRGAEDESASQMLKGVVVLCVSAPIKIEDIRLKLTGTKRFSWHDHKTTPGSSRVNNSEQIYLHRWPTFWGTQGKSAILERGNYEFPFQQLIKGTAPESVEGLPEASVTYRLKATIGRGKLAHDMYAYKHVRLVRTLDPTALEFLHAMTVENIWPNKVDYSIVIPQKAVIFGGAIPLETRLTPLLKGLEIQGITVRLVETYDLALASVQGFVQREHRFEREVQKWEIPVSREEHWHDTIEETGQEGWVLQNSLDLPKKLGRCLQDVNSGGIKIRHRLKMVVSIKNPDGHISELRATLPVNIFISPNIPLDEEGNITQSVPDHGSPDALAASAAPPTYGQHILDQLYDEVDIHGHSVSATPSGVNSPMYSLSTVGSSEDLASMNANVNMAVLPAALSSRLMDVSQGASPMRRSNSYRTVQSPGNITPYAHHFNGAESTDHSPPASAPLSRQTSPGDFSGPATPEHVDLPELSELCKVPSYATALKTTKVPAIGAAARGLPDYQTALRTTNGTMSAPTSAPGTPTPAQSTLADPLEMIREVSHEPGARTRGDSGATVRERPSASRRRQTSLGLPAHLTMTDIDDRRRLQLLQARAL